HPNREALLSDDSFVSTLAVVLADKYGTEYLKWTDEGIARQVRDDFNIALTQLAVDKIMAGVAVITTDFFYQDLARFLKLASIFAGNLISVEHVTIVDAAECTWAITEAMILHPPEDLENAFSTEIRAYLGQLMKDEGFIRPPDVLRIAIDGDFTD